LALSVHPFPGHLLPLCALGRELVRRGHRVQVLAVTDAGDLVRAQGIDFAPLAPDEWPAGRQTASMQALGTKSGLGALRYTIEHYRDEADLLCRRGPEAIRSAGFDALLVDQTVTAGAALAEHLDLPFVTVCCALAFNREPGVPPATLPWNWRGQSVWAEGAQPGGLVAVRSHGRAGIAGRQPAPARLGSGTPAQHGRGGLAAGPDQPAGGCL
jgi:UDP:flavonoid glycosyltransferase YjiC (YdhE family)